MASLYNNINANKRKTWLLVILFSIFTVILITIFGVSYGATPEDSLIFGTIIAVIYSSISFYFADKVALTINGAKNISKKDAPEIYRIVENLSITAGIPTPKIYIINDPAPNAFATGRDPKHASIALTTGILSLMNKQELEGVIAHELSHIKNFDIRLMTIVIVLIGMIVIISDIFTRIAFFSGRGRNNKGGALPILLIAIVLGILSPIIAQVIKLAISRTREYLADSSASLLTRYPEGLASALEKLRDNGTKMQRANNATAHLFISSPFGSKKGKKISWMNKLFSTHPPINDRIAKLKDFSSNG